jgi:hypothetical protein
MVRIFDDFGNVVEVSPETYDTLMNSAAMGADPALYSGSAAPPLAPTHPTAPVPLSAELVRFLYDIDVPDEMIRQKLFMLAGNLAVQAAFTNASDPADLARFREHKYTILDEAKRDPHLRPIITNSVEAQLDYLTDLLILRSVPDKHGVRDRTAIITNISRAFVGDGDKEAASENKNFLGMLRRK